MATKAIDAGRAVWLQDRRRGIGGTDAAAILGASKWSTPYQVWLEKTGRAPEAEETEAMWWGRELEEIVARRYAERVGCEVVKPEGIIAHPDHPVLIGTPDRLVVGKRRGVEIKTASVHTAEEWGREGSSDIPPAYWVQTMHYMALTGFPLWDVAVLIGGSDFRIYTVLRDAAIEAKFTRELLEWWQRHVVGGEQPPVTGRRAESGIIGRIFDRGDGEMREAGLDAIQWARSLVGARLSRIAAEEREAECVNNLKLIIGDAEGVGGEQFRATWRPTREKTVTDWEAVARRLSVALAETEKRVPLEGKKVPASDYIRWVVEEESKTEPGARRFVFRPAAMLG